MLCGCMVYVDFAMSHGSLHGCTCRLHGKSDSLCTSHQACFIRASYTMPGMSSASSRAQMAGEQAGFSSCNIV